MAKKLYEEASVQDIAVAIREKTGGAETYKIAQMGNAVRGITGAEAIEWHQCPEAVRNYLANVTYDPSDYTTSQIANYAPATAVVSNYKPIGQIAGGVMHYNEVPNVLTPFASGGKAGTLKPLDALRWIRTTAGATAWNVRDLGGWNCDGGTVKYGLLFRGGKLTAEDRAVLVGELGIQHDLDLRGREGGGPGDEPEMTASPLGSDVWYTRTQQYAWYALTPVASWQIYLRCVIDAVTHREPVYFHCTAGADRTGTLACVLEGLLGMSQSDIDKDYELTTFSSGSGSDATARRRNESDWKGLISEINGKSGSTFRDKCVTFAAELGFTADEINAFRAAMIDGTPETVTLPKKYTITKTLLHAADDNNAAVISENDAYSTNVAAENGYVIGDVRVTMGGDDITITAWSGTPAVLKHKITSEFMNCASNNTAGIIADGESYSATITADEGYTLDGAIVTVTMGGVNVANYYSNGVISIPKVTGDIHISVTAVEQAEENLFDFGSATAYYDVQSAWHECIGNYASFAYKDGDVLVTEHLRTQNTTCWTCAAMKDLPAGRYTFSGEFKQDSAGASGITVYATTPSNRLIKNSILAADWKHFSYTFTLSGTSTVYIGAQNDNAASGKAYLRNVKVCAE